MQNQRLFRDSGCFRGVTGLPRQVLHFREWIKRHYDLAIVSPVQLRPWLDYRVDFQDVIVLTPEVPMNVLAATLGSLYS